MRYLDAARLLRFKRNINSVESFGDAIRFTQRTLPGKKKLNSVRLARQNSGNFAILSWDFLRKFCNISTPDAFLFGSKRNFDFLKSFISVFTRFCASQAGRVHDFFLRKARRNSGDFKNTKTCVISTPRACFFTDPNARLTQTRAPVKPYGSRSERSHKGSLLRVVLREGRITHRNFMKTQQNLDFFGFLQSFRESSDLRFTKNLMELE